MLSRVTSVASCCLPNYHTALYLVAMGTTCGGVSLFQLVVPVAGRSCSPSIVRARGQDAQSRCEYDQPLVTFLFGLPHWNYEYIERGAGLLHTICYPLQTNSRSGFSSGVLKLILDRDHVYLPVRKLKINLRGFACVMM